MQKNKDLRAKVKELKDLTEVEPIIKEVVPADYNDLKKQNESLPNKLTTLIRSQVINRDRHIIRDIIHNLIKDN